MRSNESPFLRAPETGIEDRLSATATGFPGSLLAIGISVPDGADGLSAGPTQAVGSPGALCRH